ncbi:MAG: high-potential iron-sulfur protein [Xanthomonadales bacterium]|nr:high-potential iron-sulfur protein [Xanthomonadales bacterium]
MSTSNRRHFLIRSAVAVSSLPLIGEMLGQKAHAALPMLPLDNPQAKALQYVEDASATSSPAFKAGSSCANCSFFNADTGACTLFPGFAVEPKGWCAGWALKS